MSTQKNSEKSQQWFDAAFADLEAAQVLRNSGLHHLSCFLSQQAAEKSFKGFLVIAGKPYPKEHSLEKLSQFLPESEKISQLSPSRLDRFYIAPRYPEALPNGSSVRRAYDRVDADDAFRVASGLTHILAEWSQMLGVDVPWPKVEQSAHATAQDPDDVSLLRQFLSGDSSPRGTFRPAEKNTVREDDDSTEMNITTENAPVQSNPASDGAIHQQLSQSNGKLDMFAARMESFNNQPKIKAARENAAKYGMEPQAAIHQAIDQHPALKEQFLHLHKMFHEHIQPVMDKHAELIGQLTDPQQQQDAYHALNARSHRLMDAPKDWPDRNKVVMTENATSNPDNAGFEAQNSSSMGMVIAHIMEKLRNNLFDKSPKANTTNTTNNDSAQTTAQPHPTKKKRPGGTP